MGIITDAPISVRRKKATASSTVQTLQFLRFVAAAMVVIAHVAYYVHHRVDPSFQTLGLFAQGVGLFFVISGFIMIVTAAPNLKRKGYVRYFIISRLIRIVPLYWALNVTKIFGLFIVPGMIVANPTVSNVIFSFLFLPAKNADGKIEAFYGVGWSLNFEMAFYALFAFCLFLGKRPAYMLVPLLLACAALSLQKLDNWPTFTYLLSPILLNFVWGILIAEWYLSGRRLATSTSVALIVFGLIWMFMPITTLESLRGTQLQYALIVLGFVALERDIGQHIPKSLTFLGDASYSLYLTHPMLAVFTVVILNRLVPWMPPGLIFTLTITLAIAFSAAVFVAFERPVTFWLRGRFLEVEQKAKLPRVTD